MTETSEDKTKRKLSALLLDHNWTDQYSVFYREIEKCTYLTKDTNRLKKLLKSKYPNNPFLICYRTLYKKERGGLQAYITIFSTTTIDGFSKLAKEAFDGDEAVRHRRATQTKIERIASAIRNQRPHDLNLFFGKPTRRYSVINKALLNNYVLRSETATDK